jgi:hypothetical protein
LLNLKQDNVSLDSALKKTLTDLDIVGSLYSVNNLCIYQWASLCSSLDHNFYLFPLLWQKFFLRYLQRAHTNHRYFNLLYFLTC